MSESLNVIFKRAAEAAAAKSSGKFSFGKQRAGSEVDGIGALLVAQIAGAVDASRAGPADDRAGTDWWVKMATGHRLSVDVKIRSSDIGDDYALETWSVVERQKVGWTRDAEKRTDFVLWFWQPTGRWALVPFQPLCAVFSERWEEWRHNYGPQIQSTTDGGGWTSECVFVPRKVVWHAIYARFSGQPPK